MPERHAKIDLLKWHGVRYLYLSWIQSDEGVARFRECGQGMNLAPRRFWPLQA